MAQGVSGVIGPFNIYVATKASWGQAPSQGSNFYQIQLKYSQDYNVSTNQSTITFTLQGRYNNPDNKGLNWGSVEGVYQWVDGNITVDGSVIKSISASRGDGSITFHNGTWSDFSGGTFSTTVNHAADGSKSIAVGLTSNNMSYYGFCVGSGAGNVYYAPWGIGTVSQSVSLTTIPRASSISATNCTIGGSVTFTIGAASSSFTHKIEVYLGSTKVKTISSAPWSWTPGDISGYIASNLSYIDATYYLYTYSGGTHIGTKSTTSRISMPSINTAADWSGTINSSKRISWTQNLASYKTTVQCFFGSKNETLVSQVQTTYKDWTPPYAWSDQIPSKMSGDGTLRIITYANSSSGYRQLGYVDYKLTLNIPDYKPTVSFTSVVPVSDNSIVNGWGVYVKGYSKCRYVASASGNYNSSISSASFTFAGQTASGLSNTTGVIGSVGTFTARITVTDSRGKTNYADFSAKVVYDYGPPVIVSSYAYRSDANGNRKDDGNCLTFRINAKTDYSCGGKNTVTVSDRFREATGTWTSWYTQPNDQTMISKEYNWNITKSYQFELRVVDSLGGTKSVVYTIPTASVAFNIKEGGKGAAFFGYAQTDGVLEVNGGLGFKYRRVTALDNGADLNTILECGMYTSNSGSYTFQNSPVNGAFQLWVEPDISNFENVGSSTWHYGRQILKPLGSTTIYYRTLETGSTTTVNYGQWHIMNKSVIMTSARCAGTTTFQYNGRSITVHGPHKALIFGYRSWGSGMPIQVGISTSGTSFSGLGGVYYNSSPNGPNHRLQCCALNEASETTTYYLWTQSSSNGESPERLMVYVFDL